MHFRPEAIITMGNLSNMRISQLSMVMCTKDIDVITKNIHDKLTEGVKKRLDADAPLGFLLSGGLDSSLVCAIAADILKKPSGPLQSAWTQMRLI